jgi:hypothetical protein
MFSYFSEIIYYTLYIFIIYSHFGGDKNNNFLKQFKKLQRIPNFLFPLHQFFETQEYRFSLQGKFIKRFSPGMIGKQPVNNLHFSVRYFVSEYVLVPFLWIVKGIWAL